MIFNKHLELNGTHAFLGASNYHWINYTEDKLYDRYLDSFSTQIGTLLHEFARKRIEAGIKLRKSDDRSILFYLIDNGIPYAAVDLDWLYENFMTYVNDAIGYGLIPEQKLVYSDLSYGTADAISFNDKTKTLRIHDYKSGKIKANPLQLYIYAALFCLEYKKNPSELEFILCIYQGEEVSIYKPDGNDIQELCTKIVNDNKILSRLSGKG